MPEPVTDLVNAAPGTYRLEGALSFATVSALRPRGLKLLQAPAGNITIDLSAVRAADSAGLALLIDWLAAARASHCTLCYVGAPAALLALAQLSDVAALINGP